MARSAFAYFAVVLVMLMMMEGWRSEAAISCDQAVAALTPCINYARVEGTVAPECCNGIRQVAAELKAGPDLQATCQSVRQIMTASVPDVKESLMDSIFKRCGV